MKILIALLLSILYHVQITLGVVVVEKYCVQNGVSIQQAIDLSSESATTLIEYCANNIDLTARGSGGFGTDIVAINKTIIFLCPWRYLRCTLSNGSFNIKNTTIRIQNIDFINTPFSAESNSKVNISYVAFRSNTNNNINVFNALNSSVLFDNVVFTNNQYQRQDYSILYVDGGEYVNLSSVKIENNMAQRIFSVRNIKSISILNTTFNSNCANSTTANVFSESNSDTIIVVNTSFINNTAFLASALELSGIDATIRNVSFVNNTGIEKYFEDKCIYYIRTVASCVKSTTVTIQSSNVILDNCSFIGNTGMNTGYISYSAIIIDPYPYPNLFHVTSLSCNNIATSFSDSGKPSQTFYTSPKNEYSQSFNTCSASSPSVPSHPSLGFFGRIGNWLSSIWKWLLGRRTE